MKQIFVVLIVFFYSKFLLSASSSVESLLSKMTLPEKIGQMVQINKIKFEEDPSIVYRYFIGSVLSGGGDHPRENKASSWAKLVEKIQSEGQKTRLKIPYFMVSMLFMVIAMSMVRQFFLITLL